MLTTLVNMHNLYTVNTYSIFKAINSKVSIQDDNAESFNIVLLLRQKVHHVKTSNIITKQFSSKRTEWLVWINLLILNKFVCSQVNVSLKRGPSHHIFHPRRTSVFQSFGDIWHIDHVNHSITSTSSTRHNTHRANRANFLVL